jgi:hypothetical protein
MDSFATGIRKSMTELGMHASHGCAILTSVTVLRDCHTLSETAVVSVLRVCPNLRKLDLSYAQFTLGTDLLSPWGLPELRELRLENIATLTDDLLKHFVQRCPRITVLYLDEVCVRRCTPAPPELSSSAVSYAD